ncbi:hypothetical protein BASA50_006720 [Batrachochytrium salamandrivorans]|uniref:Phosphoglycerate mutase n=1 Tax=Batrachochytrium salamandrivorans TaxID=1357716 RepID=A0ABQ8FC60_9FUNG|nr:hypothetical protein BASA60_006888 [Batrachochytrium salamandrivorans]KAH6590474.1 hypothetical protein BASA61_005233 [Batrachochytrium salamandrivorans]KAH6594248.1 hypothetical protein BASA50_006720 [Batrachochytrium salamandrivorans]
MICSSQLQSLLSVYANHHLDYLIIFYSGETEVDRKVPRVLQGQSDYPMNGTGIQQSNALAWRLRQYQLDYIYCSDLSRTKQMALEIGKHHQDTPIVNDERLREMDLGELTGLSWPKVKSILKAEDKHFKDVVDRQGERPADFRTRVINFYCALISRHLVQPHEKMMASMSLQTTNPGISETASTEEKVGESPAVCESIDDTQPKESILSKTHVTSNTESCSAAMPNKSEHRIIPKIKQRHVLLVTHGGWIEQLMKHLIGDLHFTVEGRLEMGFPKTAAAYQFVISKSYKANGDYEWEGSIKLMNCLGHLASLQRNSSVPYTRNLSDSAEVTAAMVAGVISPSPSRRTLHIGPGSVTVPCGKVRNSKKKISTLLQTLQPSSIQRVRSLGW